MFTQCPDCGTVFRVTATVLRAARGQVRCGVCDATFDALQYLTEEADVDPESNGATPEAPPDGAADAGDAGAAAAPTRDDAASVGEPASDDEHELEFDDEAEDDDGGAPLSDAETEERILDATYASPDAPAAAAFPLEELDDPIDVIAQPGSGPAPEFPPFDPEVDAPAPSPWPADARAHGDAPSPARADEHAESGHFEIVLEDLDAPGMDARGRDGAGSDVPGADAPGSDVPAADVRAPVPSAPVAETRAPAPVTVADDDGGPDAERDAPPDTGVSGLFERRAGRNTPSADEDRALAEIAAALARRAQSPPATGATPADGDDDAPSLEIDLLDPSDAENIVLGGDDDVPDSALEFDLPAEEWDRVFVPDATAATIPPLDPTLARARDEALRAPSADAAGLREPPLSEDDVDVDFELESDADEDDDGDLADEDLRPPPAARPAHEDSLSRTDEFPPLRVTLAEEAAAGLADTPAARPRTGVAPEDFDALVAAAAARAAAEVAARVGASASGAGASTPGAVADRPAAALAADRGPPAVVLGDARGDSPAGPRVDPRVDARVEPRIDPMAGATDGGAENAWFTARRDLAPEGAPIAALDAPETIQFDAQRFQAIVRGRRRRPWWRTALYALGSLVLLLALGVQAAHYWRETLAQDPMFGPPIRAAYARLGLPLEPRWNLAAYDVKQWGATSDVAPGTLRVRASIVNRAPRAQPHPLLRVTLLDRFSAKVARREFAPAEYLPGRTAPTEMLAAGARVDADLVIADPGSDAVGFELDVCLKRRGVLECAGDAKLAVP